MKFKVGNIVILQNLDGLDAFYTKREFEHLPKYIGSGFRISFFSHTFDSLNNWFAAEDRIKGKLGKGTYYERFWFIDKNVRLATKVECDIYWLKELRES
ncbi:unnamed protein product [marine sediment metagenome]|uniref:Uncharacterized protein n=1 Tax=marine sediment metagenome TaxID=412755 RepID=X1SP23_9ZZZZ